VIAELSNDASVHGEASFPDIAGRYHAFIHDHRRTSEFDDLHLGVTFAHRKLKVDIRALESSREAGRRRLLARVQRSRCNLLSSWLSAYFFARLGKGPATRSRKATETSRECSCPREGTIDRLPEPSEEPIRVRAKFTRAPCAIARSATRMTGNSRSFVTDG